MTTQPKRGKKSLAASVHAKATALLKYGFTPFGAARAAAHYLRAPTAVLEQVRLDLETATR